MDSHARDAILQGIGFFIFLFVVYKFVLPPLADAVEGRRRQIADGLAEASIESEFEVDVRYAGQAFEVPLTITADNTPTLRVALFTRYTRLGASSRLRFLQFLPLLQAAGIQVDVFPLFDDAYLAAVEALQR